jgi:hypothetical protein
VPRGLRATRVVLVSWTSDTSEAVEHLRPLAEEVEVETDASRVVADPPDAVVLDLAERPDEALATAEAVRDLPRVFVGGSAEDVERIRELQPDARFTDWDGIGTILRTAVERPPN